jgi:hypothetical protein
MSESSKEKKEPNQKKEKSSSPKKSPSPVDEQARRNELIANIIENWGHGDNPIEVIPPGMWHRGELVDWPLPLLESINEFASYIPGELERFQDVL